MAFANLKLHMDHHMGSFYKENVSLNRKLLLDSRRLLLRSIHRTIGCKILIQIRLANEVDNRLDHKPKENQQQQQNEAEDSNSNSNSPIKRQVITYYKVLKYGINCNWTYTKHKQHAHCNTKLPLYQVLALFYGFTPINILLQNRNNDTQMPNYSNVNRAS